MQRKFQKKEDFIKTFMEYIEKCKKESELPNIAGFCVYAKMNRDTFYAQKDIYSDTFKEIQEILEDRAINAKINDTFKIFYLKNKFNYRDKQENHNITENYEDYIKRVERR